MRAAAVIFDMDGVIVDSEPRHEQAFLDVIDQIGYAGRHGVRFADYVGRSDNELWVDFLAKNQTKYSLQELLAMKSRRVIEIIEREDPLFEEVPGFIEKLSTRYKLALASGSDREVVDAVLGLRGLRRFFPVSVSASDVEVGKPAPDIFLRAADLLGVRAAECWVIEDSKPGVAAGLAAGMRVVAITNTHRAEELAEATHVARSYAEVERILLPANGA